MDIADLKAMSIAELTELAGTLDMESYSGLRKQDLIFRVLEAQTAKNGHIFGVSVLF